MTASLERDHSAVPRPAEAEEKIRFCATCGERIFITLLGSWAHPHAFVPSVLEPEGRSGGISFCAACAIFQGSAIHQAPLLHVTSLEKVDQAPEADSVRGHLLIGPRPGRSRPTTPGSDR